MNLVNNDPNNPSIKTYGRCKNCKHRLMNDKFGVIRHWDSWKLDQGKLLCAADGELIINKSNICGCSEVSV